MRLRFPGIPNISIYIVAGQVCVYALAGSSPDTLSNMLLVPGLVARGEAWRLLTFILVPPSLNLVIAFFGWYLFYLMGTALEKQWGAGRYTAFLAVGYAASVASAFLVPGAAVSNAFLGGSVFLAFAYLYPDFVIYVMFILPVKIRWMAMLTWLWYGWTAVFGAWSERLMVLAATANFLVFFARDIVLGVRRGHRQMSGRVKALVAESEALHKCVVCGATEKTASKPEFRYCTKCVPAMCYCMEHMPSHEHKVR